MCDRSDRFAFIRSFRNARQGATAVLFALMLIPIILSVGAATDFARLAILKSSLQSVTDGAALAGASVLNTKTGSTDAVIIATDYFNKDVTALATTATVGNPTVTVPTAISVTVSATATLQNSFMNAMSFIKLGVGSWQVVVTATAEGPAYTLQVTKTGGFNSSAEDGDSIYYYDATTSSTPNLSGMTLLFTNDPNVDANWATDNTTAKTIRISANDIVGFALVNKTGDITAYSKNAYGGKLGTTHIFYSALAVPSLTAYSSQGNFYTGTSQNNNYYYNNYNSNNNNCNTTAITTTKTSYIPTAKTSCYPYPCTTLNGGVVLNNNLLIAGSCSTQATASQTCLQLYNNPVSFAWNDMGGAANDDPGGGDDYDYNDAVYTVSCMPSTTSQPAAVILTQ